MSAIPNFPQDIIIDIIYCLPAKSLARFRCVSKPWLSILANSKFIKTHLNRNIKNEKLLVVYPLFELNALTLTPQNDYVSTKLNFPPNLDQIWLRILGSSRGLVLAFSKEGMFLINPTTSDYKKLPEISFNLYRSTFSMYGFGYDEYSDDFKIVSLSFYMQYEQDAFVDVYSLKANSWTRIQVFPFDHIFRVGGSGVLLHGAIHWAAATNYYPIIAALDLTTEKFRGVEVPSDIYDVKSSFDKLVVLDCCLCMIIEAGLNGIDVWMMKEYGVQGSWIKLIRVSNDLHFYIPVRLVGDLDLLVSKCDTGELKIFNGKEGRLRSFIIDGDPAMVRDGWAFVESLVSLNLNC